MNALPGLHHITAICGTPQTNADFYTGTLRQRLVKRTVNFDDPATYHLYYGDAVGSPGSILTFFPFMGAGPGRAGAGMAESFSYAVAPGTFDDLEGEAFERFGETGRAITDPDGLRVELVESERGAGHFHGVALCVRKEVSTARILTDVFGYERVGQEGERVRYISPDAPRGAVIDLLIRPDAPAGLQGTGTIHHVAFRAEDDAAQMRWKERLDAAGLDVTQVIDRQYFNSIYFREPGGVLFEIATDPPGFAHDESEETMGNALMLPEKFEDHRAEIERLLPPLDVPAWSEGPSKEFN